MATSLPLGIVSLKAEGAYSADKLYKKGMWVTSSGSSYAYIHPIPAAGVPLTDTSHWQKLAEKGATIVSGAFNNDILTLTKDDGVTFQVNINGITSAATAANEKATLANEKALLADEKATLANQAAVDVTQAIQSTEAATLSALEAQDANANWTKDTANPLYYFPAPSAPLYFRREGTFTQAGSGDPSPTNIRPITPFMANGEQITLANRGKNLMTLSPPIYIATSAGNALNKPNIASVITNTLSSSGQTGNDSGCGVGIRVVPGSVVSVSFTLFGEVCNYEARACASVSAEVAVADQQLESKAGLSGTKTYTYTIPAGKNYLYLLFYSATRHGATITNLQLELGSVATPYEPYAGSTATLTAPQEIAAGWMDNEGRGESEWGIITLGTGDLFFVDKGSFWNLPNGSVPGVLYDPTSTVLSTSHFGSVMFGTNQTSQFIYAKEDKMSALYPTVDDLNAYLQAQHAAGTPVTIAYKLATPQTITPITAPLNTLPVTDLTQERLNVFTSSMNGVLTYPKSKVGENRKLWNSQSWRKTTTNPATVYPVPESPLYPKISGTSTQEGTGDPSPENIRPITPWLASGESIEVRRTGKNLLPSLGLSSYVNNGVTFTKQSDGSILMNGTASGGNAIYRLSGAYQSTTSVLTIAPGVYTLSKTGNSSVTVSLAENVSPFNTLIFSGLTDASITVSSIKDIGDIRIIVPSGTVVSNLIVKPQLELGPAATPYEPYTVDTYEWTAPQDIYGVPEAETYVDWDKRELVVTARYVELTGLETYFRFSTQPYSYYTDVPLLSLYESLGIQCSHFTPGTSHIDGQTIAQKRLTTNETRLRFTKADCLTPEDFASWVASEYAAGRKLQYLYVLATPIRIPLTDLPPINALPQLDRITPRQNVVTTSAGVLEVTYAEQPKFDFGRALNTAKSEKMTQYEHISQMRFSGSMDGMTKEVPKVLRFEYRGAKNYISSSEGSGKRESGVVHTGYAEVKWQGTSSIAFPKKNFTVKLFEDEALTTKKKVALRETWGEQNKYCMKANFIDSTQCRNVVAAKVWGNMVRSRNTSSESYIRMRNLPNAGAVDGYPILVFLNDQYIGLYTMNIPKDEWMFGMEDGEGMNVVLCGESWAASAQFKAPAVIDGSDWDYEVEPADKSWVVNSFNGIYNALALPHDTEQEKTAKRSALEAVVDIYSVIDYQIFLEALCVTDNTGKNQLLATYDGTKWIMSAYDLDTAFAMSWSGARYHRNDTAVGTNNLTNTVKTLYPTEYNARKTALKTGALDPKAILQSVLNFAIDIPQEAYRAEAELWPDQCGANTNAMQQIISFVMTRPELNS